MIPNPSRLALLSLALLLPLHAPGAQYTPRPDTDVGAGPAGLGLAHVSYLSGEAFFRSADSDEWAALATNLSLRVGDRLSTDDGGRLEVRLADAATAWLSYRSELDLVRLRRGGRDDAIQLALVSGEGSFDVLRSKEPGWVFQVDLPGASVRAFDEARFRVNALPDGQAQIGVAGGSVELETPDGVITVRAGQLAELRPDGRVAIDFLPPLDDWDAWVRSRADWYDSPASSARYLPPDMYSYAREFDDAGRWVSYAPHGYVWVPTVAPGWSPYSHGRWVWMAGDYVWLSYDPWYAPFHYGRWNFTVSLGWYWVAPRRAHWSPGFVGWSLTDTGVCWVPLGHGEVYFGYGSYGPDTVNVYTTRRINVTNVYINARVQNGVVVVRRDDFLRGRIIRDRGSEPSNPFVRRGRGSTVIGRPPVRELRPTRETRMPRPEVVRRFRPPERVERESDAIRRRPVATGRGRSVFAPDRPPRPHERVEREPGVDQMPPPERRPMLAPRGPSSPVEPERPEPARPVRPAPERDVRPGRQDGRPERLEPSAGTREAGPAFPEVREAPASPPPVGRRPFRRLSEPPAPSPRPEEPRGRGVEPRGTGEGTRQPQGSRDQRGVRPGGERRER